MFNLNKMALSDMASNVMPSAVAANSGSTPPKKYININGVTKLNPAWKKWKEKRHSAYGQPATTTQYPQKALPVVTNMEDYKQLNQDTGKDLALAEATVATMEIMREPDIAGETGLNADNALEELGKVLNKYECPIGLMNKLMVISEYEILEFMIDDSGSMNAKSDTLDSKNRKPQTRWQEAQSRLKNMIEILAYVPFNEIQICFLNRSDRISLRQGSTPPEAFMKDSYRQIDAVFGQQPPRGTTPVLERLHESLARGEGKQISRYLFCDGQPDGGNSAKARIVQLLMNRPDPQGNPVTFLSCTGDDDQVEWMKDAEEVVSYCAECDDFSDEADEVYKDQGKALPFTVGFYLVCSLVAAVNPNDLDAMDESVPFTKSTLDNLLGIQHDERTYKHYWDCFLKAQQKRPVERDDFGRIKKSDQLKKNFRWQPLYQDFLRAPVARDIPAVQQFLAQLKT